MKPDASPAIPADAKGTPGWEVPGNIILANLTEETQLIVELGSWLGYSARFMLENAPKAVVICIDHWRGSPEHEENDSASIYLPNLYNDFLSICWEYRDRIVPVRELTLDGMRVVAELGLTPDIVYVDASHDYESVKADLEMASRLFPTAELIGDDYDGVAIWKDNKVVGIDYGVRRAVNHFVYDRGWGIQCAGRGWQILRRIVKSREYRNGQ